MKKILIVVPNLNNPAGTERAAINLANMLVTNYSVTILSLTHKTNDPFFDISQKVNIIYEYISNNNLSVLNKAKWFYSCYSVVNKIIKKNNINVAIGLTHNVNSVISLLKNRGLIAIGCEHIDYKTIPPISKRIISKVYSRLDALVILSKEAWYDVNHLNNNIVIIPNPLSFETDKQHISDNKRIIMVGRLSREKGYERVIPLSKYLAINFPEWQISIFGEGYLKSELKAIIEKNNLSNTELHGTTKDIMKEYLNSSIFISTSHNEAFGMAILEAMQVGLPVVSYRHHGSRALISNNINGIIVENEHELIEQTSRLMMDINLRKKIGAGGRNVSSSYTPNKIKDKWLQLLNSID